MAPPVTLKSMKEAMDQQMVFDCLELGTMIIYLLIIMLLSIAIRRAMRMNQGRGPWRPPAVICVHENDLATPNVIFEVNVNVDGEKKGVKRFVTRKVVAVKRSKLDGDSTVYNNLKAL